MKNIKNKRYYFWFFSRLITSLLLSPPFYIFPAIFAFSISWIISREELKKKKNSIIIFATFIYGYFCGTFSWFASPMTIQKEHWALIPIGILGSGLVFLSMIMIIYAPLFWQLKRCVKCKFSNIAEFLYLSIGWCLFEEFRSKYLFGGLPWQTIGTIFTISPFLLWPAKYIGRFGLDFLASLIMFSPVLIFFFFRNKDETNLKDLIKEKRKSVLILLSVNFLFLLIIATIGIIIIPKKDLNQSTQNKLYPLTLLGIQGNIDKRSSYLSGGSLLERSRAF